MAMNNDTFLLGKTDFRGQHKPFGIRTADLRRFLYCVGQSGAGKSSLLANLALRIAAANPPHGLCVIDPHGQLADDILDRLPSSATNRVIYFAARDEWPISLNILETATPATRDIVASSVVSLFKSIWGETLIGPRSEDLLRNAVFALMGIRDATLLWIPRLFVDTAFRTEQIVPGIRNPVIKQFWEEEYEQYDARFRQEVIAPLQNKMRGFLACTQVRNIVAQPYRKVSLAQAMDRGQILICNLSKGLIGEDNAALLASLIAEELYLSALGRADRPEEERRDYTLIADEIASIGGSVLADMLSEARKYHLSLVLAHQYLDQLSPELVTAIFGNVGSVIAMRLGARDSHYMAQELSGIAPADFEHLPNHHAFIRLSVAGQTLPAFSMITLPLPPITRSNKEQIIKSSRQRYGRERGFVEQKIAEWLTRPERDLLE